MAECVDHLGRYEEMGADAVVLRVQPPGLPQADALRTIEAFGEGVLPQLASR